MSVDFVPDKTIKGQRHSMRRFGVWQQPGADQDIRIDDDEVRLLILH